MIELGTIIQSKSDTRTFKAIELENQMQCIIISDPEAKKSSAALSVEVGSFQDPIEAQGIAHYLEHMLFMGTKKYPDENIYRYQFIYSVRKSVNTLVKVMLILIKIKQTIIFKLHVLLLDIS